MTLDQESDPLRRIPTKHAAAQRTEIGPILRAARLKRGQSLGVVAQKTRISKRFLEAIEENHFEQFPAVVYLRGFLQGYCEHLDVNFDDIWAMLNTPPAASMVTAPRNDTPSVAGPVTTDSSATHSTHAAVPQHGSGATGAIVLAVILTLGLGIYLFKDQGKGPGTPAQVSPAALQPMTRAIEPNLIVRLKNDVWLRVSVDGQIMFEGRAPRDAVQEWRPSKFVDLRTTEPAALDLSLNGQPVTLGAPGPDGQYRVEIP